MGTKIREKTTGQIWTIVGDGEGHSLLTADQPSGANRAEKYRIKNEATGEERMIAYDFGAHFELLR